MSDAWLAELTRTITDIPVADRLGGILRTPAELPMNHRATNVDAAILQIYNNTLTHLRPAAARNAAAMAADPYNRTTMQVVAAIRAINGDTF